MKAEKTSTYNTQLKPQPPFSKAQSTIIFLSNYPITNSTPPQKKNSNSYNYNPGSIVGQSVVEAQHLLAPVVGGQWVSEVWPSSGDRIPHLQEENGRDRMILQENAMGSLQIFICDTHSKKNLSKYIFFII